MGIRFNAVCDLLARYRAVFREAWQQRKQLEPLLRERHEAEFLPAALALRDTPVHPAPRATMWLILVFALLTLCWALLGHVDVVATASGKIVPDSQVKVIQPLEVGTVRAIHVRDGQRVRSGDRLIELDPTETAADVERVRQDVMSMRLEIARNLGLLRAQEEGGVLLGEAFAELPLESGRLRAEHRLLEGRFGAYLSRLAQMDAEIAARAAEYRSIAAQVAKLKETLPIVQARVDDYRSLLDKKFVSKHGFLEVEQTRIEMQRDLLAQQERLAQIAASRTEAEKQRMYFVAESRRDWLDRLQEAEQRVASFEQELLKAENRGRMMILTAPVDGVVQQLAMHTIGGVVTQAQPLMVIVPGENPLEVEAMLPNKDVGFVHAGQAVEAKVETFSFTKYGTLSGQITHVSPDAIQDENLGLVFAIRVRLDSDVMNVDGRSVRLSPGMAVTIEVKTGSRRLIECFLGPLIQYADESLRER